MMPSYKMAMAMSCDKCGCASMTVESVQGIHVERSCDFCGRRRTDIHPRYSNHPYPERKDEGSRR